MFGSAWDRRERLSAGKRPSRDIKLRLDFLIAQLLMPSYYILFLLIMERKLPKDYLTILGPLSLTRRKTGYTLKKPYWFSY